MSEPSVPDPRAVLVTGASGGIGAATARALHRQGRTVVLHHGGRRDRVMELARELGERVHVVGADLADPRQVRALWADAVALTGGLDGLVNNAGAWIASPLDQEDDWAEGWQRNLQVNLVSAADLCRQGIEHFRQRGGGAIVNVTSRSAHRGDDRDHLAYGAAKAGLLSLTKGIARAFAAEGVLAYAVAPSWVATELAARELTPEALALLPMREPVPADEVGETIAFLLSGRARHLTGATLDITGADYVR